MPYVNKTQRDKYRNVAIAIQYLPEIETKGDLEYLVFLLQLKFMKTREPRYGTMHEAVYAVNHAAHEFERRYLDKREDKARQENGDIQI